MRERALLTAGVLALAGCRDFSLGGTRHSSAQDGGTGTHADAAREQPDAARPASPVDASGMLEACARGCTNPDAQHCTVQCVLAGDAGVCKVRPNDGDGDGHGDPACTDAPQAGRDCDDGDDTVYPGAPELCDGRDNDCNGRHDLADGLSPVRADGAMFGGTHGSLAWNGSGFGVAYEGSGHELLFGLLDGSGNKVFDSAEVAPGDVVATDTGPIYPEIAWGGGVFAVTWTRKPSVYALLVDENAIAMSPLIDVASGTHGGVAHSRVVPFEGGWLALFDIHYIYEIAARTFTAEGDVVKPSLEPEDGADALPALTTGAGTVAAASLVRDGRNPPTTSLHWQQRTSMLEALAPGFVELGRLTAPASLERPMISGSERGYAVAWSETLPAEAGTLRRLVYMELDLEGNTLCGPVDLALDFDEGALPVDPVKMVASTDGHVILGEVALPASGAKGVDLVHVRAGCEYVQRFRAQRTSGVSVPDIVSAETSGFMLLWQGSDAPPTLRSQLYGPRLCD